MQTITILIPIHNRLLLTQEGLKSVYTALNHYKINSQNTLIFEIVVIDDGSSDGSSDWIAQNYVDIHLLKGNGDLWWTGAINLGAKYAVEKLVTDYTLLWNDDTICDCNYFVELEKILIDDPKYKNSILTSKIYWQDNPQELFNFGCYYNRKNGKKNLIGWGELDSEKYSEIKKIDWSGGMGTLIPKLILKQVNYFDDKNFPQYHGDIDFFLRAQTAGFDAYAIPTLKIWNNRNSSGLKVIRIFSDFIKSLKSNRSNNNFKQNFLFNYRHSNTFISWMNFTLFFMTYTFKSLIKIMGNTEISKFLKSLRQYMFNAFFTKIPFTFLRLPLVRCYIILGKDSNVCPNTKILSTSIRRSKIRIGNNCAINPECLLDGRGGNIIIGNNVDIARGTWIYTIEHDPHSDYHETISGDVIIEENVWIASRVIILPGVTIGRGSVIASGAVVTKDIPPMSIAGGVPAKVIGVRKSKLLYKVKLSPYLYI